MQKPSFAAVNGHAYGLGCGIALSCDFRVAGEAARFNEAFIRNGIVPADGSAFFCASRRSYEPRRHYGAAGKFC